MPSHKTYQAILPVFIFLIILIVSSGTVYLTLENAKTARQLIKRTAQAQEQISTKPNLSYLGSEENRLTHQNEELNLKFQYPQDWEITTSGDKYIYLKDARGAILTISLPALDGDLCHDDNAYEKTNIYIKENIAGQKYNCLGGVAVYFQKGEQNGVISLTYPAYISSVHYPTLFDEIIDTLTFE